MKKEIKRMEHKQVCCKCGRDFSGFEKQHTCFDCIKLWIKYNSK